MGQFTISMAIFNGYVTLPEGKHHSKHLRFQVSHIDPTSLRHAFFDDSRIGQYIDYAAGFLVLINSFALMLSGEANVDDLSDHMCVSAKTMGKYG